MSDNLVYENLQFLHLGGIFTEYILILPGLYLLLFRLVVRVSHF